MRPIVVQWLKKEGYGVAHEILISGYCDLAGYRFAERKDKRIPELMEVITVELKINDIAGAIRQAINNLYFVNESYVAMPLNRCVKMRPKSLAQFTDSGIGLLGIDTKVTEIISPNSDFRKDISWMKKKMWRWERNGYQRLEQKKQKLYPIKGKFCGETKNGKPCGMPAVYRSGGNYDHYYCRDCMPEKVKAKYE